MKTPHRLILLTTSLLLAARIPLPAQDPTGDGAAVLTYLEPRKSPELSASESGIISEILVKEGDRVMKDQVLLKLDSAVLESRLAVAKAQADNMGTILAAEADYKQQKDRYEKLAKLEQRDVSSQYEVQRQLSSMKVAEGKLAEALEAKRVNQLQAELAAAELDRRLLKSPIDGIAVEILKEVGESVSLQDSGRSEHLIRVVKVDELQATAHIPSIYSNRVKEGAEMEFRLDGVDGAKPTIVKGTVEYVNPVIDSASGTIRIRLVVNNAAGTIRAGSQAHLLIPGSNLAGPGRPGTSAAARNP
jgi:RND family efflux transporter MFP subunit